MIPAKQCVICIHRKRGLFVCEAFPEKIPEVILSGRFRHNKKYPEQRTNILFKLGKPKK